MNYINNIITECIRRYITEADFNYHHGNLPSTDNVEPYYSENDSVMSGNDRDTGYFGSGIYFSTYQFEDNNDIGQYNYTDIDKGELVQISDNLYRIDFDLYKNLYRVNSNNEGHLLHNTLKYLQQMKINVQKGDYNLSVMYQKVAFNCKKLGLKCPTYRELLRLMKGYKMVQSFSTYFMEMNGFNGVNVSNLSEFDNTTYGSVIYDLNKTSDKIHKVDKDSFLWLNKEKDMGYSQPDEMKYIEQFSGSSIPYLNRYPKSQQLRIMKNYALRNIILPPSSIELLDDDIAKWYLNYIYIKCNKNLISNYEYKNLAVKFKAYAWMDYIGDNNSFLISLLDEYQQDMSYEDSLSDDEIIELKKKYLKNCLSHMHRGMMPYEKDYINNEYYRREF